LYLPAEVLAVAAAKLKYDTDKAALESGDLAKVPLAAPAGLTTGHGQAVPTRRAPDLDPKTIAEYAAATIKLTELTDKVRLYLAAEALALAAAKHKYDTDKVALESGDLAKVPATAPTGLGTEHGEVGAARAALSADPKT